MNVLGPTILAKYPKEIEISQKTMIQLYSQLLYSESADVVSLLIGAVNLIGIWTGAPNNYILTVLLTVDENGDDYVDLLPDSLYFLIPYIAQQKPDQIIATVFNQFQEFPSFNEEQKLALTYFHEADRTILNLLLERRVIS